MGWAWLLVADACTGCGICADVCSHDAISHPASLALPTPGASPCVGCGDCVGECPFDAVVITPVED